MKNKIYKAPELQVMLLHMTMPLLSGSITESTGSGEEMSSGSFGARGGSFWDDEEE